MTITELAALAAEDGWDCPRCENRNVSGDPHDGCTGCGWSQDD
jgi:hypothetical protein